jgi:L-ascorbate metabolism protein UlaG (beta-lactamase superfamily)
MADAYPRVLQSLHWLGHDSYRIDAPIVIYLDPWNLPEGSPPGDLVLVSHEHSDHCSPEDVQRVRGAETVVVADASAGGRLTAPVKVLRPGESTRVKDVEIAAVPAYNIGKKFHPREAEFVGYVLTLGGERLYFAGDTDHIPEMQGIQCDIALLPVSGVYVMTAEEAAEAAGVIKPGVVVPMHYGAGVAGTEDDARRFEGLCPVPVFVMQAEGRA